MTDPTRQWRQTSLDALTGTRAARVTCAAAIRVAEAVCHDLAGSNPDEASRWQVGGPTHATIALATYRELRRLRPFAHLDPPPVSRCIAEATLIREWLTGPSPLPGFAHTTVAETWSITDDAFHWEADSIGSLMTTLIVQAQRAGVFGAPDYAITLRHLTAADPDDDTVEHQVTLASGSGAVLASAPIATDHLADDDLTGVDAAVAVLTNTAAVVNELLVAEGHLIANAPRPPRPPRGFGPLDLEAVTALPAAESRPAPHEPGRTR
jgi:hypothetical protein